MMRIGLLASGNLGNIVLNFLNSNYPVIFVMTDKNSGSIIEFCKHKKINYFIGNPRGGRCTTFIQNIEIEVLISINYLFLIDKDLISLPNKMAFNIHGSLLPKYRGRTPHVWAIINNEKETGISAHQIDEGCDTGDIIDQVVIPIKEDMTGADILSKFSESYIPLIKSVLNKINDDTIVLKKQEHHKASFFGKRTPDDGQINWNWQKERIRNWVRAQAYPYPGAFTLLEDKKITIDRISYQEAAFFYDMPNGLVISIDPLLIKTPNGVVKIDKIRETEVCIDLYQTLKS